MEDPLNAKRVVSTFISVFQDNDIQGDQLMPVIVFFMEIGNHYSLSENLQNEVEGNLEGLTMGSFTAARRMLCSGPEGLRRATLNYTLANFTYVKGCSNLFLTS